MRTGGAAAILLLAGCVPTAPPVPPAAPVRPPPPEPPAAPALPTYDPGIATATLLVQTKTRGPLPRMRPIKLDADPKCGQQHLRQVLEETIVATDGKLANVIAWISKGGDRWTHSVPEGAVILESRGCVFSPHVLTLQAGQRLTFMNLDPVPICLHGVPSLNPEFHRVGPKRGPPLDLVFAREEVAFPVKDDCYVWMKCWVGVLSHPFHGVTDREGRLAIKVPPGEYEVSAWHEYAKFEKPAPRPVAVADGETKEIEFVFEAR